MPSIEALEKLLKADPGDAFILYGLAHEYAKLGQHETAITYYDRCLVSDPDYCYAYYHKARSQQAIERMAETKQTLQDGIARARKAGDGHAVSELQAFLLELN